MDITKIIQKARPNLKPQSIKTYLANIRKISGEKEIEDLRFLNNPNEIFEKLNPLVLTMKRNILSAIIVLISALPEFSVELYQTYADKLLQFTTEYKIEMSKNQKSATQEKNWTSMAVLSKIKSKGTKQSYCFALYHAKSAASRLL